MGARLFFRAVARIRGCGELPFPGLRADPQNPNDLWLLGKMLSTPRFLAGGTASFTHTSIFPF
jgi:hypothetical protein